MAQTALYISTNRQIAADKEEELANQGEVLRGGISRIYLSLLNKWKPCHRNCKQLWVEARNSMSNCDKCIQ